MAIEMGKKYRTRDGRDVRILCVDRPGNFPVVGLIDYVDFSCWTAEGGLSLINIEGSFDLIEISPYSDIAIGRLGPSAVAAEKEAQNHKEQHLNVVSPADVQLPESVGVLDIDKPEPVYKHSDVIAHREAYAKAAVAAERERWLPTLRRLTAAASKVTGSTFAPWMDHAYDLNSAEEEKIVTVRTFTRVGE